MLRHNTNVIEMPLAKPPIQNRDVFAKPVVEHRVRLRALTIAVTSALVLVPCFWQRTLEAGDLSSHAYNAWLAQLLERGQAVGLSLGSQSNNVLFDLILSALGHAVSFTTATRIAAALAVLVFFWGTFAFATALVRRPPWSIAPLIAAFAYGWTFNFGFFNYYLSIGLACFALAVFSMTNGRTRFAALALVPLVWLAHPLGLAWFFAAAAYIEISRFLRVRLQMLLIAAGIVAIAAARVVLARHFVVAFPGHSALFYSGLDQLIFTNRYEVLVALLAAFFLVSIAVELRDSVTRSAFLESCAVPLGLYALLEAGVQLLPDAIRLPQYAAPLSDLTARLTLISAVLLCCLLAGVKTRLWQRLTIGALALAFAVCLYQDTARIGRMRAEVDALVDSIPHGQRVIFRVQQPLKYRFSFKHVLDEACIGRYFSYANYEPASRQFRVRAAAGNPFVLSDIHDVSAVEAGTYIVQPRDLPLREIYQCGADWTRLCIRSLPTGPLP